MIMSVVIWLCDIITHMVLNHLNYDGLKWT